VQKFNRVDYGKNPGNIEICLQSLMLDAAVLGVKNPGNIEICLQSLVLDAAVLGVKYVDAFGAIMLLWVSNREGVLTSLY
jgi:hypothetical protein